MIITTGTFTADARRTADRDGAPPIEFVDGDKLVEMFEFASLGVRQRVVYEIDHAFFSAAPCQARRKGHPFQGFSAAANGGATPCQASW
ncbi:restriction endonuclease [Pseudorhodoferax sp.]|uniref:restriction endonuclease n=1 Tax=Pseudorhodoferax sp. TaxID=1993553 RepID=UPI0039E41F01